MKKFSDFICKNKNIVLIISFVLLALSFVGMKLTKINYDILVYLPSDIETIEGQDILTNEFNMGAYALVVAENVDKEGILKLENQIKNIEGVNKVGSIVDVVGTSVPLDMLPKSITKYLVSDESTLLLVTFNGSTSSEETIDAVDELRNISENLSVGGMSSMVLDTMNLSNSEITIYIVIAVILCIIVLAVSLDSYIVPVLLLVNIGMSIVYNLGTNIFLGQISYITKALVAVLQLGVTTDFSIFLYHSYQSKKNKMPKESAMSDAISETFTSVTGSSLTTIAGFLVLCLMRLTLGKDLGIVMAKGVLLGLIAVLTIFPCLLLTFDNLITKTSHKVLVKPLTKLNDFIVKHYIVILIVFLALLFPMYKANSKVEVYYKIDETLPKTLESIKTNNEVKEKFNIVSPEIILISKDVKQNDLENLTNDLKNVEGINLVLSESEITKYISIDALPSDVTSMLSNDKYKLILINSVYEVASDELNGQITKVNSLVKKVDKNAIVAGEGPLMKDLITISNKDFDDVNSWSIICIFLLLVIVLRRFFLPILLVSTIEFAIFTNLGISYFAGDVLPFVAPITLGTIQLGATIDYAILLTTTYLEKRKTMDKVTAIKETLNQTSVSIIVSASCFFAATFGVGVYSDLEMVGSLCSLISRGALISMVVVLTVLPSILLIFDKLIVKESEGKMKKINKKKLAVGLVSLLVLIPTKSYALTKEETVFTKLNSDGTVNYSAVSESILNNKNIEIKDYSILENITNLNSNTSFTKDNNYLTWNTQGENILYSGITNKELPVKVSVKYKLDGEELELKDMLGKSGKVEIIVNYKNLDKHVKNINGKNETIYTPFVVTMGTYLDNTINKDITVNNGKTVTSGSKTFITGVSIPGLSESLKISSIPNMSNVTISYETKEFSLNTMYFVIVPKIIDNNSLSELDKLNTLYGSVNKLQSNMDLINENSNKLASGTTLLKNTLNSKIAGLSKENILTNEVLNGIKSSATSKVNSMFTDSYMKDLSEKVWLSVKEESQKNEDEGLNNIVSKQMVSYLNDTNLYNDYVNCKTGQVVKEQGGEMTALEQRSCYVISQDKALPYFESLTKEVSMYVMEKVSKEVSVSVSKQTSTIVASELSTKVADSVVDTMLKEVNKSLKELYSGIETLDNGMNALNDGITSYNNEGIKVLSSKMTEVKDVTSRVKALVNVSNEYKSFTESNMSGETKFILKIDSAKKEVKSVSDTSSKTKTTFFQRLKNLFK